MRLNARALLSAFALVVLGAGCRDGASGPEISGYTLSVSGRVERGLTVHVGARSNSSEAIADVSGLTVSPPDAATVTAPGELRLLHAGTVILSAIAPDGVAVTQPVDVSAPPFIVFDGLLGGNRDVYRVAIDGSDASRLTTDPADDMHPTQSGNTVVFNSFRDGNSELYAVNADGTIPRRLTTTAKNETEPALSPGGTKIAYVNDISGVARVWVGAIDASAPAVNASPLTSAAFGNGAAVQGSPNWAPGSDRLVLMTTSTPSGSAGLFLTDAVASSSPELVVGSGVANVEVEPAWSADGFLLAYAAVAGNAAEIFVRDLRTSVVTQLTTTGSSGQPCWLADGRIVFTAFSGAQSALYWIDPAIPATIHLIPTSVTAAQHPAPVRP